MGSERTSELTSGCVGLFVCAHVRMDTYTTQLYVHVGLPDLLLGTQRCRVQLSCSRIGWDGMGWNEMGEGREHVVVFDSHSRR